MNMRRFLVNEDFAVNAVSDSPCCKDIEENVTSMLSPESRRVIFDW